MPGRVKAGVDGIASRISCGGDLLVPGVNSVRPRLPGFLLGGEAGFTKAGGSSGFTLSTGASVGISVDDASDIGGSGRNGKLVVDAARA